MNHGRLRKIISVILVVSIAVPALLIVGSNYAGLNYLPQNSTSVFSQNYSYVKLTHVISTNVTYDGFHQVGSFSGGLTAELMHSGVVSPDGYTLYTTTSLMSISEVNTSTLKTIRTVDVRATDPYNNSTADREWISNIVLDPMNGLIYATVVNSIDVPYNIIDVSYLCAINPINGSIVNSIPLDSYSSGLAFDQNNGMLYAVSATWNVGSGIGPSDSFVNEVNPSSMAIVKRIQVPGLVLKQIAFNSARDQIYIPIFDGKLAILNTTTDNVTTLTLSSNALFAPTYVTYSSDYVYVASVASQNISVVSENTLQFAYNITLPYLVLSTAISYDQSNSNLYLADFTGNINSINVNSRESTGILSTGTPTQALIYNSERGSIYAVGSGSLAYISEIGVGPAHSFSCKAVGLLGPTQWTLTANGVQYDAANGSVSFTAAGDSIHYHVITYAPYLIINRVGTLTGTGNAVVTIYFINIFLVIIPLLAIAGFLVARRIVKNKRK